MKKKSINIRVSENLMTETLLLILEIKQPSELQEPTSIRKSVAKKALSHKNPNYRTNFRTIEIQLDWDRVSNVLQTPGSPHSHNTA